MERVISEPSGFPGLCRGGQGGTGGFGEFRSYILCGIIGLDFKPLLLELLFAHLKKGVPLGPDFDAVFRK